MCFLPHSSSSPLCSLYGLRYVTARNLGYSSHVTSYVPRCTCAFVRILRKLFTWTTCGNKNVTAGWGLWKRQDKTKGFKTSEQCLCRRALTWGVAQSPVILWTNGYIQRSATCAIVVWQGRFLFFNMTICDSCIRNLRLCVSAGEKWRIWEEMLGVGDKKTKERGMLE